jgi:hypothetical protein
MHTSIPDFVPFARHNGKAIIPSVNDSSIRKNAAEYAARKLSRYTTPNPLREVGLTQDDVLRLTARMKPRKERIFLTQHGTVRVS